MKKMFAVGATAALLMTATSPAFAHTLAIDDGDDVEFNAVAQNISGGFDDVEQSQFGEATADATADASGDSAAAADVSQSQGFTFVQFNSALNDF